MTLIFKLFSYNASSLFFIVYMFLETLIMNDVTLFINTIMNIYIYIYVCIYIYIIFNVALLTLVVLF